jgi:hypothetical protein
MIGCLKGFCFVKLRTRDALVMVAKVGIMLFGLIKNT